MPQELTPSEQFVYSLSRRSFLALWSYLSPRGKTLDKELCDILIVCHPHVIIISVKEVTCKDTGRANVDWNRWERRAVANSIKQIAGAEHQLDKSTHVITRAGSRGIDLPDPLTRIYHRIAIAFGANREVPLNLAQECPNSGAFVHVLDEKSTAVLMQELDTITDFVDYLEAKERLLSGRHAVILEGGEEDVLALYLHNNRTFPDTDMLMVSDDLWQGIQKRPEFKARKELDADSYVWDRLIDRFAQDILCGNLELGSSPSEGELVARTLALENRFARRLLGRAFAEFLDIAQEGDVRSRCLQSPSGVNYVFLATDFSTPRKDRISELGCRTLASIECFPAQTIVGIATEVRRSALKPGHSLDFVYLYAEEWTEEDRARARAITEELGYFKAPKRSHLREDEYPLIET